MTLRLTSLSSLAGVGALIWESAQSSPPSSSRVEYGLFSTLMSTQGHISFHDSTSTDALASALVGLTYRSADFGILISCADSDRTSRLTVGTNPLPAPEAQA